jgi:hypothetical protein
MEEDYTNTAVVDIELDKPITPQFLQLNPDDLSLKWFINGKDKNGIVSGTGLKKQIIKMYYDEIKNGLKNDTRENRNNYCLKQGKHYFFGGRKFLGTNIDNIFAYVLGHVVVIEKCPIPFSISPSLLLPMIKQFLDDPVELIEFYQIGHPEYYNSLKKIPKQDLTFKNLDEMFQCDFKKKVMSDLFDTNPIMDAISVHFSMFAGQLQYNTAYDLIKQVYCLNLLPEDRSTCFIVEPVSFYEVFQKFVTELTDTEFTNLIQHCTGINIYSVSDIIKVMLCSLEQDIGFDTCKRIVGISDKIYTLSDLNDRIRPLLATQDLNMIDNRK